MRLFGIFLLLATLLTRCTSTQQANVFPKEEWDIRSPESQKVDSEKLQHAIDYLSSQCLEDKVDQLLIVRNGYVIHAGDYVDSVHNIWSCSKTFTSTVLGLLIDDGVISLNDKAAEYEPLLNDLYADVSFRHFTTMTSGYSAKGDSRWPSANYADWSWTVYEPDNPYFAPGTAYAYWDEAQMMFGRVLTQILQWSMHDFLKERITDAIGMGDWTWHPEQDIDGILINNGCTNVFINAKQFARWGWLFLNQGNWDGVQLISKQWVEMATSVQVSKDIPVGETDRSEVVGPGCYGFNWWVNGQKADGKLKLPGAPEDCYFASGLNNNKCIVIPSLNMVIVRMGEDGHPPDKDQVYGAFLEKIGEAIM